MRIIINFGMLFVGYVVGRWTHVYLNAWTGNGSWFPHHWILGGILLVMGRIIGGRVGKGLTWLAAGMIISDFNDMIHLRTFQPDNQGIKKFWGWD